MRSQNTAFNIMHVLTERQLFCIYSMFLTTHQSSVPRYKFFPQHSMQWIYNTQGEQSIKTKSYIWLLKCLCLWHWTTTTDHWNRALALTGSDRVRVTVWAWAEALNLDSLGCLRLSLSWDWAEAEHVVTSDYDRMIDSWCSTPRGGCLCLRWRGPPHDVPHRLSIIRRRS